MPATKTVVTPLRIFSPLSIPFGLNRPSTTTSRIKKCQSQDSPIRQALTKSSMSTAQIRINLAGVQGQSGRIYKIDRILQDRGSLSGQIFLAVEGNKKYVLKEVPRHNYGFRKEIYDRLKGIPHIRGLIDTAPAQSILVFDYLDHHLLELAQKNLPLPTRKQILKQALSGLAAMHAKDIIHNDIKPNNIFIAASEKSDVVVVEQTVLADLEDSAYCPPPGNLMGAQLGNWMWRSPEAHAEGPMNKPSDIFAFAIVCIYAMTGRVIFYVAQDDLAEGEELLAVVLQRQLSYFGDPDMFTGLLEYLTNTNPDNPWIEVFRVIQSGFSAENPREPFAMWEEDPPFDEQFRDLVTQMTRLDPRRRITANEALEHVWFKGV